jgi:hypothetical protein
VGPSIYQCNLGTNRKWKIRLCQAILVESPPHLLFRIESGILHNSTRCDPVLGSSCVWYCVRISWQRRIFHFRLVPRLHW